MGPIKESLGGVADAHPEEKHKRIPRTASERPITIKSSCISKKKARAALGPTFVCLCCIKNDPAKGMGGGHGSKIHRGKFDSRKSAYPRVVSESSNERHIKTGQIGMPHGKRDL